MGKGPDHSAVPPRLGSLGSCWIGSHVGYPLVISDRLLLKLISLTGIYLLNMLLFLLITVKLPEAESMNIWQFSGEISFSAMWLGNSK